MTEAITAPTDAQLGYIADLCRLNGQPKPAAIHSSREASEIIGALRGGSYAPSRYEARREAERRWLDGDDDETERHAQEMEDARYGVREDGFDAA